MISTRMKNLHPYVPGEQPKDRVYIKLNANENPFPPSVHVQESVINFVKNNPQSLSVYPDPESTILRQAISSMINSTAGVLCKCDTSDKFSKCHENNKLPFEVTPEMIFVGNGSDEILSFVFYSFFDSKEKLVFEGITFQPR